LSALTKIAVVLLVVASLLLSAGVVVFVNKVEHFKQTADAKQSELDRAKAASHDSNLQVTSLNSQLLAMSKDLNSRIDSLKQELATKETNLVGLNNQLAKLDTDKKVVEVALANMTKVQEGLQGQLAGAQTQITALRADRDKLETERNSVNVQLTDALSKVEALEHARRVAEEKAASLQTSLADLKMRVAKAGFKPDTLPDRSNEGTPMLEGVVKEVFPAGGKPYASITLGSKDNVVKGMKFNVVNDTQFLGYLTIQSTEPNEATGVLDGPAVDKVHTGDQVKTQLQ
jgi:predicted  nucleic acid-binding Zn-ribbon protein